MNLDSLKDFANEATVEIAKYTVPFTLSPEKMMADEYPIPILGWDSISYGDAELAKVPADKRGVYAFVVFHSNDLLPPHGYVLYIGIAGRNSKRPLKERYKDYLNVKKVERRPRIARMIATWHEVLRFFFAPVGDEVSSDELKTLESKLNTAFMPPFSEGDLEADTKQKRRAFRL